MEGRIVNHKKVMRLVKENGLSVRPRRRFIATTDSDHDGPIFPNLAKNIVPRRLNQLWVADITYITIATGFVYLAAMALAEQRRPPPVPQIGSGCPPGYSSSPTPGMCWGVVLIYSCTSFLRQRSGLCIVHMGLETESPTKEP
jgi:hypothetical protein